MSTEAPTDHLSPAVRKAVNELASAKEWISGLSPELGFPGGLRNQIAGGCFDQVLEHQIAIAVLVERELNGSAMALMRVTAEGLIRGLWFQYCATDDELERFLRDDELDKLKRIRTVALEVEAALGGEQDVMSRTVISQWGTLCSYTHTGFLQISRRYTGALLKPSYSDRQRAARL